MNAGVSETETLLRDEIEQLRTALEDSHAEQARLAEERRLLSDRLGRQAREYGLLRDGHARLLSATTVPQPGSDVAALMQGQTEEELRVAFEELQVMTEELEASNKILREVNRDLDRRVEERTLDLARANDQLRASETSLLAMANLIPDMVLRFGQSAGVQWGNARWFAYTGQDEADMMGWGWLAPIHPAERPSVRSEWQLATTREEGFSRECRLKNRDGAYRWFLFRFEPTWNADGQVQGWYGAVTDTHEQRQAFQALQASEARFRTLIEGIPQLVWRSRQDGYWSWSSPQWTSYTGQPFKASLGYGWLRALHPDDQEAARSAWSAMEGEDAVDTSVRILNAADNRYRHFQIRATPVRREGDRVLEWLGTSTDVDDMLQLQDRQNVLVAELQHRTRNLMGMVVSLVRKTLEGSTSLADFKDRVDERLAALARVQGLLSRRVDSMRITFDELLRAELAAHVGLDLGDTDGQVRLSGPAGIGLRSAKVQTFALALHELTTNALKYGALSSPAGRLAVSWNLAEGGPGQHLVVDWRETGVTRVPIPGDAPQGGGYGRELIERALPYQLRARTEFRFDPGGVHCVIDVPLD